MPRFTETERESIQAALLTEGERLFALHGLKKVTVDDLADAVNISKGSFYAFYPSKEHLFVTINFLLQERLFSEAKVELEANKSMKPKELARHTFKLFFERAMQYPILPTIDVDTMQYLQRKLPKEVFTEHTLDDAAFITMLEEYGISFSVDSTLVAKTMQTIFGCSNMLIHDSDCGAVMDILIGGIVNLIK